ncbi:MAG: NAD(P)/FAD-dependent oxidoreductase [Dehalococcoidia bacterium]
MTRNKQIVVIGGGIVGASVAFHLAKRGAKVTVIEAGQPGQGASRVSYAWINGRDKSPFSYHELNRRSQDMWRRFEDDLRTDIGLIWGGEMRWTVTDAGAVELRDRVAELQSWGYSIREISTEEASELEPGVALGNPTSVSYTESDGHVDPVRVSEACLDRVVELGGTVVTGERVQSLEKSGDQISTVITDSNEYACDGVAIAAGAKTPDIAAMAGFSMNNAHSPGATVVTSVLETSLFSNIASMHTPRDTNGVLLNMRQLTDGRVMIHGGTHAGSIADNSLEDAEMLLRETEKYLPVVDGLSIDEIRKALRPMPSDGFPVIGALLGTPNAYVTYTHSGVTLAPIIGEMAALEIVSNTTVEILAPYRPNRFK